MIMECICSVPGLRSANVPRISVWNAAKLSRLNSCEKKEMKRLFDEVGVLSARSQKLKTAITDYERLLSGPYQHYLLTISGTARNTVIVKGLLKVGHKNLFIQKQDGNFVQINPLCVLDFYIHETCQRIGLGRQLFEAMLSCESKFAHQLGYDRPSSKLLSFLGKFYSLKRFLPQANQFVVFTAYFDRNNDNAMVSKPTTQRPNCHCIKTNRGPCVCSFLDVRPSQDKAIIHGRRTNTINLLETASEKVTLKSSGQNILKQEFGDKESTNTIDSGHKNKSILKENLSKSTKMSSTITDIHESEAFGHHSEFCNEGRVFLVSKNNSEDTGHVAFGHGYEKAGSNNRPSSLFTNRINRFSLKPCEINKSKENIQLCSAKKQLSNISPFYNKASPSILDHEDQRTNRGGTFNRTEDNHDLNILGTFQPGHTLERRSAESSNWRREYNSTLSADLDPQACGKCKKTEEKSQPADILFTKQELSDISNMCNKDPYCKLNSDQLTNRIGSQTSPRSRYLAELSGCGAAAALGLSRPIKKSGSL